MRQNGAGAELQARAGSPGLSRSWGGHPASPLCPAGMDTRCHVLARDRWAKATFPEIAACTQGQPGSSPTFSRCGTGGTHLRCKNKQQGKALPGEELISSTPCLPSPVPGAPRLLFPLSLRHVLSCLPGCGYHHCPAFPSRVPGPGYLQTL